MEALKELASRNKAEAAKPDQYTAGETSEAAWGEELDAMRKAQMKETPPEAWEDHYAEAEKAKKAAEAFGFKTEINPENMAGQNSAPPPGPTPPPAPGAPGSAPTPPPDLSMPPAPAPSAPPAPPAPLTPEQLQTGLEASRAAFAKEREMHEAARKQHRGFFGRAWESMGGSKKDIPQSQAYKLTSETYQKAKVAMAQSKLGTLDAAGKLIGPSEAITFIEKEMGAFTALLTPEKQSMLSRALQAYARMPKKIRIPLTLALSTIAATGVIAATGGFASVAAAASYAGLRGARAGAGVLASTAVTEGFGSLRNKSIDKKQSAEKAKLTENLKADNIDGAMARIEALAGERQKFDKKTGSYKALMATAIGGGSGLYAALSHVDGVVEGAVSTHSPVFPPTEDFRSGTDLGAYQKPPGVFPPTEDFRSGTDLGPNQPAPTEMSPAQGFGDDAPNPNKYGDTSPAQGFGEQPPFANNFDPNDIAEGDRPTVDAPATELQEPSANYADNPPTQEGVLAPRAPSEPVTVTAGDAKKGLWGILERKLKAEGSITESTTTGQKNAMLAQIENKLRALGPDKLKELGFTRVTAADPIGIIRPGDKLDLSMFDAAQGSTPASSVQSDVPTPATRPSVPTQPDAPSIGIKSDVPLPPPRPRIEVPVEPSDSGIKGDTTIESSPGSGRTASLSTEAIAGQPLSVETINSTRMLLAKGIMSPPDRAALYSNWTTIKTIVPSFENYQKLNSELLTARDTFKINLDNKTVGQVLGELAQKRSGGKVLAA